MTEEKPKDNQDGSTEYFEINPSCIDTNIVKRIGINKSINSIIVEIDSNIVSSTIHLEAFSEKTIKPLKKDLNGLLTGNRQKQSIVNSIVTCIIRNIERIKDLYSVDDEGIANISEGGDAIILYNLATKDQNIESLFKDQYGRPYASVRLGSDHHLEIVPLISKKFRYYLARLFKENTEEIVSKEAINNALNVLAANAEFEGKIVPLHLRVAWGNKENRANEDCIYYDMTDTQGRIVEISKNGWRIISGSDQNVPVLFKKHNQTPQVEPDRKYPPDIFDQFINITNVRNPEHRHILKVLIVCCFIPEIDHPILTTYGAQGSAKSFLLRLINASGSQ